MCSYKCDKLVTTRVQQPWATPAAGRDFLIGPTELQGHKKLNILLGKRVEVLLKSFLTYQKYFINLWMNYLIETDTMKVNSSEHFDKVKVWSN